MTDDIADTVPVAGERQPGTESILSMEWLTLGLKRKK